MSKYFTRLLLSIASLFLLANTSFAGDKDFPDKPNPPRLVNDFAGVLNQNEQQELEQKLADFSTSTSTQITLVTIKSLGDYEVEQYAVELANRWGIGEKSKNNGVLLLASIEDHKINISTGYGLEGALTDVQCGRIIRNEMVPAFKQGNYFEGFSAGADAIIAATKGEYKADEDDDSRHHGKPGVVRVLLFILFILWILSRIGGGGGRRRFGGGWIGGPFIGGGGWGGGSSGGGGGFGGFGGGGFGGGGASGSW